MIETIEHNGTKMSVDHTRSWVPTYQSVRQAVREGQIGDLTRIVAHMGGSRSMLFRNGTHLVDAVCYFAEANPVCVLPMNEVLKTMEPNTKGKVVKIPVLTRPQRSAL